MTANQSVWGQIPISNYFYDWQITFDHLSNSLDGYMHVVSRHASGRPGQDVKCFIMFCMDSAGARGQGSWNTNQFSLILLYMSHSSLIWKSAVHLMVGVAVRPLGMGWKYWSRSAHKRTFWKQCLNILSQSIYMNGHCKTFLVVGYPARLT
jgi:hypothetical protein